MKELTRLKELEHENAKLKRRYAELALEHTAMQDVLTRTWGRRPRSGRPSES